MWLRFIAAGVVAIAVFGPAPAVSTTLDTAVGQFESDGGRYTNTATLVLATASDAADKGAGFVVHVPDLDKTKPGDDILIGFFTKDDWQQFVSLWDEARRGKPPANADKTEIGDYLDPYDEVLLQVGRLDDGAIELMIYGKTAAGTKGGSFFNLLPQDIEAFNLGVEEISAYFGQTPAR